MFKGITRRWYINIFGVILIMLIILDIVAITAVSNYFYSSIRRLLETRADITTQFFNKYSHTQYGEFYSAAIGLVSEFNEKDKMEMHITDTEGRVIATTSNFLPESNISGEAFTQSLWGDITYNVTKNPDTGEKIMVVNSALRDTSGNIRGVARFIVSLRNVDNAIFILILASVVVILFLSGLVFLSGNYLIRSIVAPVNEISKITKALSGGDFSSRIEADYNDEIGELARSINNMASELYNSEQMKNDFISSVSHELRTPLTAIKGWSETMLLCQNEDSNETVKRGLSIINEETDRLKNMVEELLDFAQFQNNRIQIDKKLVDVGQVLIESVFIMKERASRDEIVIEFIPGEELPNVIGDEDRLKQVFINILDNAIKHSFKEQTVSIISIYNDDSIIIKITDTGTGIDEEDLPNIKKKFFKGTDKRGSGIGLAIADEIVSLHDGSLNIESVKGEGVTVTITLPVVISEEGDSE